MRIRYDTTRQDQSSMEQMIYKFAVAVVQPSLWSGEHIARGEPRATAYNPNGHVSWYSRGDLGWTLQCPNVFRLRVVRLPRC
ncbi:uncharacterized protein FMAN_04419 [Fusarium mangiferae]|uniref:Uncharacterized protein n=1 Tax=Fusarium mangiferae TaxID=192010 RepID=A0A1L7T3A0_FUSMA|nr:uncharacterized protein FMAN_04419 [Fusarium mangiferae]CVK89266.1 uncharacterized protein FMAN_04419 [Fusarium mangiferae]